MGKREGGRGRGGKGGSTIVIVLDIGFYIMGRVDIQFIVEDVGGGVGSVDVGYERGDVGSRKRWHGGVLFIS